MGPTPLRDELRAARRALEEVQVHVRSLRSRAAGSRLASRLESDVRRVVEDLDDLDAEAGARGAAAGTDPAGAAGPRWTPYPDARSSDARSSDAPPIPAPVPVPSRHGEPEFQPECDDEGLGGGWQADATAPDAGRRRGAQSRGNGHGSGRAR